MTRAVLLAGLLALAPTVAHAGSSGSGDRITLKFHGPLREAAEKIASDGHLNVVVRGQLNEEAEFYFNNVPAQDALQTLAKAYGLVLDHHGAIWTLRPSTTHDPLTSAFTTAPTPPTLPTPSTSGVAPLPGVPGAGEDAAAEEADRRAEDAERRVEEAERRTEALAQMKERVKDRVLRLHRGPGGSDDRDVVGTGNVTIAEDQEVDDVVAYGGELQVNGHVRGDAVAFGGNVRLGPNAEVSGDVTAFGGRIYKEPGAHIGGEETAFGAPGGLGVSLGKSMKSLHRPRVDADKDDFSVHTSSLPMLLLEFAIFFGLGFLFWMFAPNRMKQIEGELQRDPLKCALTGFLGSIALVLMILFTTITVIGIPVALAIAVASMLGLAMGFSALATEIGTRLPVLKANRKTQAAVLALGTVILLVVGLVPVLGKLVLVVAGCGALGAIIRTRFGSRPRTFPEPL